MPLLIGSYSSLVLTIFQIKLASFQSTKQKKKNILNHTWHLMWHVLVFAHSVLHRKSIGHAHFSQLLEWQNLGITTPKHATCVPNVF